MSLSFAQREESTLLTWLLLLEIHSLVSYSLSSGSTIKKLVWNFKSFVLFRLINLQYRDFYYFKTGWGVIVSR